MDIDGDGQSPFQGDCWESPEPPPQVEGALGHALTAEDIYSGAFDAPYDGIDANCDGSDDFDADGDGWIPINYAGIPTYGVIGSGANQNIGDCWDNPVVEVDVLNGFDSLNPDEVHAGVSEERWYDGIDQNCDGQSDFDQDGDGQDTQDFGNGLDCDDLNADIFEGAIEIFYDGVDQDCLGGDDCDADGDGYPGTIDGVATDVCTSIEDCDDTNASIYPDPSIDEIFYNGRDDDCNPQTGDGDADGDGHWADNYESIMVEADLEPLSDPNSAARDCWDTPETIPADFIALSGFEQISALAVSPSALEDRSYDGIDERCDGDVGEFDADFDGYDTLYYPNRAGVLGTDCVDSNSDPFAAYVPNGSILPSEIFPASADLWYDGVDQNCDGLSDYDSDEDGFDIVGIPQLDGTVGVDCNDLDAFIFPGASEQSLDGVDQNCDGLESCYTDSDGDGDGSSVLVLSSDLTCRSDGVANNSDDCDDSNAAINTGAVEQAADNLDQNCDGLESCYTDSDGDAFGGSVLQSSQDLSCQMGGVSPNSDDCNDGDSAVNPNALETCNGVDNNCSGNELDASDVLAWYADTDGDLYGDPNNISGACTQPNGFVSNADDCNDQSSAVYLGAPETCDGVDNNCSGDELDATDVQIWYADTDTDLFGDPNNAIEACTQPSGFVLNTDDCNDQNSAVYLGAPETCDGVDNNCSGDELDASDVLIWYADTDGDAAGDPNSTLGACSQPLDFVSNSNDCNDQNSAVYFGAPEYCDGVDNNCSGDELDALNTITWYLDSDNDFTGDPNNVLQSCSQPLGYVSNADDCDDQESSVYLGAQEICDNGIDEDCLPSSCQWQDGQITDVLEFNVLEGSGPSSGFAATVAAYDGAYLAMGEAFPVGNTESAIYISADPVLFTDINDGSQRLKWETGSGLRHGAIIDIRDIDQNGSLEVLSGGINTGRSYLKSIPTSTIEQGGTLTGVETIFVAEGSNFFLSAGDHVQFIGDQDSDGVDEMLIVGRQFRAGSQKSGGIFLITSDTVQNDIDQTVTYGTTGNAQQDGLFYADIAINTNFGFYSTTGDFNGDGMDDLVVGEPNVHDCVYIIYGPLTQSDPQIGQEIDACNLNTYISPPVSISGGTVSVIRSSNGTRFGEVVSMGGDIDNDGTDDLIITDYRWPNNGNLAGRVLVYTGRNQAIYIEEQDQAQYLSVVGEFGVERIGRSAAIIPDIDDQVGDDLVIGGRHNGFGSGAVYIFNSPLGGTYYNTDADVSLTGDPSINENLGKKIIGVGDLDGNGLSELSVTTDVDNQGNAVKVYTLFNLVD